MSAATSPTKAASTGMLFVTCLLMASAVVVSSQECIVDQVYISDLKFTYEGRYYPTIDKHPSGATCTANGTEFQRCFYQHAACNPNQEFGKAVFAINGSFEFFEADVGMHPCGSKPEEGEDWNRARFHVYFDDSTEDAVPPVIRSYGQEAFRIRVNVRGVQNLGLRVSGIENCLCDHSFWGNARLYTRCPGGPGVPCETDGDCTHYDRLGSNVCREKTCQRCDDVEDWTLVFRQRDTSRGGGFFGRGEFEKNPDNTDAPLYSILNRLEDFRRPDGTFIFKLRWPGICADADALARGFKCVDGKDYVLWSQTSNPVTTTQPGAENYKPIDVPYTGFEGHMFGGLERTSLNQFLPSSLLDGTVDYSWWWFAVGSTQIYEGGIPGPVLWPGSTAIVHEVELSVKHFPNKERAVLYFDGVDGHVSFVDQQDVNGNVADLPDENSPYTLEAWIKPELHAINGIVGYGNYGNGRMVNALRLDVQNGLINYWWGSKVSARVDNLEGRWTHVAASFNGTHRTLLLNGEAVQSDMPTQARLATQNNFAIGVTNFREHFKGCIAEVRVWRVGRTQAEIRRNMHRQYVDDTFGLVGAWALNEGCGTIAGDSSDNALHGVLRGGASWRTGSLVEPPPVSLVLTECIPGKEFEAAAPTRVRDRKCQQCSPCKQGQYKTGGCDGVQDSQCKPCLDSCPAGWYLTDDECNTDSHPTCERCHPSCTRCSGPGADMCTSCQAGFELQAGSCQPGSNCTAGEFPQPCRTDVTYLRDLEPLPGSTLAADLSREECRAGQVVHQNCLYTHAKCDRGGLADMSFDVSSYAPGYFKAFAGIIRCGSRDNGDDWNVVSLAVLVNDELVIGPVQRRGGQDAAPVLVHLPEGASKLTLRIDALGSCNCDWSFWGDAQLFTSDCAQPVSCHDCDTTCQTCYGPSEDQCVTCKDGDKLLDHLAVFGEEASIVGTTCTGTCPPGTRVTESNECRVCTTCAAGFEPTGSGCDGIRDKDCQACPPNSFKPTAGDKSCQKGTDCPKGTFVSKDLDATSDRKCQPCDGVNNYSASKNAPSCLPTTPSCPAGQREVAEPTPSSDRQCGPCESLDWVLVARQKVPGFFPRNSIAVNEDSPHSDTFSILHRLEEFRGVDGRFLFRLRWPTVCITDACEHNEHDLIWYQSSNPILQDAPFSGASGFEPVYLAFPDQRFGGLERGFTFSLLDGYTNHKYWWFAVGSFAPYPTEQGIPGPLTEQGSIIVDQVELYVKPDRSNIRHLPFFDGQTTYVAPKTSPSNLPTNGSPYTLEAFIFAEAHNVNGIVGYGLYGTTNAVNALRLGDGDTLINYWWGNDLAVKIPNIEGRWAHIAATFDGETRTLYLDGQPVGRDLPSSVYNAPTANFRIGTTNGASGDVDEFELFHGLIAHVKVWSRALSAKELESNMKQTHVMSADGLVGYWPLLDGCGSFIADVGPSHLDAVMQGSVLWSSSYQQPPIAISQSPPCVPGIEYEIKPELFYAPRQCGACTGCNSDQFLAEGCDGKIDSVCKACTSEASCVSQGFYVSDECTKTSDTVCSPCHPSCASCSGPSNADCLTCIDGSNPANGVCDICSYADCGGGTCHQSCDTCSGPSQHECLTCADGLWLLRQAEGTSCVPACGNGTFADQLTGRCTPCSTCRADTAELVACNAVNDTVCGTCTEGNFVDLTSRPPSCRLVSTCYAGSYIAVNATSTSDRVCGTCDGIKFFQDEANMYSCKPIQEPCAAGFEQVRAPSEANDRDCQPCSRSSVWNLVFRQRFKEGAYGDVFDPLYFGETNVDNPNAELYSILDALERYRRPDGRFKFRLVWPELCGADIDDENYLEDAAKCTDEQTVTWLQSNNPAVSHTPVGFQPVDVSFLGSSQDRFQGLEQTSKFHTLSYLDGNVNISNWWFAVATSSNYQGGIPGPQISGRSQIVHHVELYVDPLADDHPSFLSFDGEGDYIAFPGTQTMLPAGSSPYTLEAWVYPRSHQTNGILGYGQYGARGKTNALRLGNDNKLINYWWAMDAVAALPQTLDSGWHHVAATFDGGRRTLYVDGEVVHQQNETELPDFPAENLRIGVTYENEFFYGSIAYVRIWRAARTAEQLRMAMNWTANSVDDASDLVGSWALDERCGSVATDATRRIGSGQIVGASWTAALPLPPPATHGTRVPFVLPTTTPSAPTSTPSSAMSRSASPGDSTTATTSVTGNPPRSTPTGEGRATSQTTTAPERSSEPRQPEKSKQGLDAGAYAGIVVAALVVIVAVVVLFVVTRRRNAAHKASISGGGDKFAPNTSFENPLYEDQNFGAPTEDPGYDTLPGIQAEPGYMDVHPDFEESLYDTNWQPGFGAGEHDSYMTVDPDGNDNYMTVTPGSEA